MAIPNRIIEGICCSELKAEDYYSVYGKKEIDEAVEQLKHSNIEILNKYTPDAMKAAVEAKLKGASTSKTSAKTDNKKRILSVHNIRLISYAAAAVFVAAVALPVTLTSKKSAAPQPTERTKGLANPVIQERTLHLYRQENGKIESLINGDQAEEGDVLQITYQAGQSDYGIIFSVDGNGNLTSHLPNNSWTAVVLKHGSDEIPLDFSYELDNAPDFECFVFVTSKKAFDLNDIEKKIKKPTDINYLTKFDYLPKTTEAISFIIKK